jgi:hypothetical protein
MSIAKQTVKPFKLQSLLPLFASQKQPDNREVRQQQRQ